MIDLHLLRTNPTDVIARLTKKDPDFPTHELIEKDRIVRELQIAVESLRSEKNNLSKGGAVTQEVREKSIALGKQLKEDETKLAAAQEALNHVWLRCPNLPEDEVPVGNKAENVTVRSWGTIPQFSFTPRNHLQLNDINKWFDLDVAAKMSGAQFVYYTPMGTKIIYALTQMMLKNNARHNFLPVIPPYLVTEKALYNGGNLPKFAGDFYEVKEDNLCLIPTAEVSLTNVHADEILEETQLPIRYTSWTSCFRREAGGYGAAERGIIRIHQFEKVELYAITKPQDSRQELEQMVGCAESILQQLGLAYQVVLLAGQDCSFGSAKTYDLEVWLPGQNRHQEVSSASNCTDFQARRAQIRYRNAETKKPTLAHTLNASSLALPRLMVALMEQYQQEDGSIKLPKALQEIVDALW
ncbi:MAG: seryl-tRNA synthetase [Candidatus Dependentiae bacterium]|nr:seryl-tRNA synthetase [Candidatus Dependentiae bacterium]